MAGRENYLAAIGTKLELHSTFATLDRRIPKTKIKNHGIVDHTTLSKFVLSIASLCVHTCAHSCVSVHVCTYVCMRVYVQK